MANSVSSSVSSSSFTSIHRTSISAPKFPSPGRLLDGLASDAGNTPRPSRVDELFLAGLKAVDEQQFQKAEANFNEAVELAQKALKSESSDKRAGIIGKKEKKDDYERMACACMGRGYLAVCVDDHKRAESFYRTSLQFWERVHGRESPKLVAFLIDIAGVYSLVKIHTSALSLLVRALTILSNHRNFVPSSPPITIPAFDLPPFDVNDAATVSATVSAPVSAPVSALQVSASPQLTPYSPSLGSTKFPLTRAHSIAFIASFNANLSTIYCQIGAIRREMKEPDAGSFLEKAISVVEGSAQNGSKSERSALVQALCLYQGYLQSQNKANEANEVGERLSLLKENISKTTANESLFSLDGDFQI